MRPQKYLSGLSKKYLVTGVAGFIASKVCSQLLDQGDQVVGVDNLNDYYDIRLKKWRLQQLDNHQNTQNFYFEKLDIENQESLKAYLKIRDHLMPYSILLLEQGFVTVWKIRMFIFPPMRKARSNLLECMRENGCPKFVLASTSSLYAGQKMPFTEDLPVNEPLIPICCFQESRRTHGLQLSQTLSHGCFGGSLFYCIWTRRTPGYEYFFDL